MGNRAVKTQRPKQALLAHLLAEMDRLSMSRAELEIASGLSRTTIDEILRGARKVTLNAAIRFDRAFGTVSARTVEALAKGVQ
jgi:plasmid maintenance system antidote protein VapI